MIGVDGTVTLHLGSDTTLVPSLQRCVQTQGSVYALTPSMEILQTIIDARMSDQPDSTDDLALSSPHLLLQWRLNELESILPRSPQIHGLRFH